METQKTVNLLNDSENEYSKWYIIDSESNDNYSQDDEIKFLTRSIESSLCDYSDAYILVTRNITAKKRNDADTDDVALDAIAQVVLKTVHHLKIVEQKSMTLFLMMQILLILQCLCTT